MGNKKSMSKQPVVLLILDGIGARKSKIGNAVLLANTPVLDSLWTQCPHCLLDASEKAVGLPPGYAGHSEVGHLNLGSGQIVYQVLTQIGEAIRTKQFGKNPVLVDSLKNAKRKKNNVHLLGILSPGGVHGHIDHLFELMRVCKTHKISPYIHVILDGRDAGLKDGYLYLNMLKAKISEFGIGTIASISGRAYAMDRNKHWDRTGKTYDAMLGIGERKSSDVMDVLQNAYKSGENDQTFKPTTLVNGDGNPMGPVKDGDSVIFYNFREDRSRQLTKAFVLKDCNGFERKVMLKDINFVTMTGYEEGLPVKILYEPFRPENTVADVISNAGMRQFHISETEKYAHVTYFFNGGREKPHDGEEFYLVPSPNVFDYSTTPAMSIKEVTEGLIKRIKTQKDDFILINYANPDMLGHTGDIDATVKSLEIVDSYTKKLIDAILKVKGDFMIVSDHGNCDKMIEEVTGEPDTKHTMSPVPFMIGKDLDSFKVLDNPEKLCTGDGAVVRGILADVGVTVLKMLNLESTEDMTGIDLAPMIKNGTLNKE